jgi:hypothetical protein
VAEWHESQAAMPGEYGRWARHSKWMPLIVSAVTQHYHSAVRHQYWSVYDILIWWLVAILGAGDCTVLASLSRRCDCAPQWSRSPLVLFVSGW